jgi:hypothetical protein
MRRFINWHDRDDHVAERDDRRTGAITYAVGEMEAIDGLELR